MALYWKVFEGRKRELSFSWWALLPLQGMKAPLVESPLRFLLNLSQAQLFDYFPTSLQWPQLIRSVGWHSSTLSCGLEISWYTQGLCQEECQDWTQELKYIVLLKTNVCEDSPYSVYGMCITLNILAFTWKQADVCVCTRTYAHGCPETLKSKGSKEHPWWQKPS